MKKKVFVFTFLIFSLVSFAQTTGLSTIEVPRGSRVESTTIVDGVSTHNYSSKSNIPVNGIPFLKEDFQAGVLELNDGKKSIDVLLRYNIAKDAFEILHKNDTLRLNRPFAVKYIYLDDKVFVFDPKLRKGVDRKHNGYFELRVDDKLSLYIKRWKDLSFDSFVTNYQGGSGTKEYYYVDKIGFIGKNEKGKTFLIKSTKTLLANIDDHKSELKSFIKKNKIKIKKESDLIKVVEYYNSL